MKSCVGAALASIVSGCVFIIGAAEPICQPEPARPLLVSPHWYSNELWFQLEGAWNVPYHLQLSTNLRDWTAFSTNTVLPWWSPWIGVTATHPQMYIRAVLEEPVYPLFNFAVRAGIGIRTNSTVWLVDSYDSLDPRYSTNGEYDPAKAKDGGDLALGTGYGGDHYFKVAKIKGKVFTGQDTILTLTYDAAVGSTEWHLSGNIGVQPGWWTNDLRQTFMPEPVKAPFESGITPLPGTMDGINYGYVLGNGDYLLTSMTQKTLVVGHARVLVSSNILLNHMLISTKASLQIFCAGEATFGTITNLGDATGFQFYGLASNYRLNFYSSTLKGLVYAPNAYCAMILGGPRQFDFYGACVVQELFSPGIRIHFDEQLKGFCVP